MLGELTPVRHQRAWSAMTATNGGHDPSERPASVLDQLIGYGIQGGQLDAAGLAKLTTMTDHKETRPGRMKAGDVGHECPVHRRFPAREQAPESGLDPAASDCRRLGRGTGRGTASREIPVQSALPVRSTVLSVQVMLSVRGSRPLVMRRANLAARTPRPIIRFSGNQATWA